MSPKPASHSASAFFILRAVVPAQVDTHANSSSAPRRFNGCRQLRRRYRSVCRQAHQVQGEAIDRTSRIHRIGPGGYRAGVDARSAAPAPEVQPQARPAQHVHRPGGRAPARQPHRGAKGGHPGLPALPLFAERVLRGRGRPLGRARGYLRSGGLPACAPAASRGHQKS